MRVWKRMGALALAMLLGLSGLTGCSGEELPIKDTLAVSVGAAPESLDPIYAQTEGDQTILAHLYENLLRLTVDEEGNPTVTSGVAKDVVQETNYDGSVTYTFKLHSAKWSDGRSVRADDFVYAWQRLADPRSQSPYAELLSVVVGYEEARSEVDMSKLQVSAKNDTTLVVVLDGNYDWFLTEVCTSPATMPLRKDIVQQLKTVAEERNIEYAEQGIVVTDRWWSDPTLLVTNGPYSVASYEPAKVLKMGLSERYYSEIGGPRELSFYFADTTEKAWKLYETETVDMVWPLTETRLEELSAGEEWTGVPELGTYAAIFNGNLLQDPLVRQAMTMVIDRNALAAAAGATAKAAEGVVPPGVPDHENREDGEEVDFRTCKGSLLDNDPETYYDRCGQALQLLAEAGYDSGAALGELEYLYEESESNAAVAGALCNMWQTGLGIQITPRGVKKQELWEALRTGEYVVAGAELSAVGNDAECFLMQWTTHSIDNVAAYSNSAYDTLMAIVATAPDGTARLGCLHDAEELLVEDCGIAPLYTRETAWELREPFDGVLRDARGWFSFADVHYDPTES